MRSKYRLQSSTAGFSLLEILTVIVMIGILSAITIPSWMNFIRRQRVNAAQTEAVQALRVAQARAKKEGRDWQVSFRINNGLLQMATHRINPNNALPPTGLPWQPLPSGESNQVAIDTGKTTLKLNNSMCGTPPVSYCFRFNAQGHYEKEYWLKGQIGLTAPSASVDIGKLVFKSVDAIADPNRFRECVIASTILGSIRTAEDEDCN